MNTQETLDLLRNARQLIADRTHWTLGALRRVDYETGQQ